MKRYVLIVASLLLPPLALAPACRGDAPPPPPATQAGPAAPPAGASSPAPAAPAPAPKPVTAAAPSPSRPQSPPSPPPPSGTLVVAKAGLRVPESVLYDPQADVYIVSNIDGSPLAKDDNGFLTRLDPTGKVRVTRWVNGRRAEVQLNAPKGMAIQGDTLYVADIDVVRRFDRQTGAPRGVIEIPGATFLNDLAAGPDGSLYVSDSGFGPKGNTGTDAVWRIEPAPKRGLAAPIVHQVVAGTDLAHPNGLAVTGRKAALASPGNSSGWDLTVWVVSFGGDTLRAFGPRGEPRGVARLPAGGLDGLVAFHGTLDGGTFLVSSWKAQAVFRGTLKGGKLVGAFEPVFEHLRAPADIGWDTKRQRLLVPRFEEDAVQILPLPAASAAAP